MEEIEQPIITAEIASHVSKLEPRVTQPHDNYEWMRCQLGKYENVSVVDRYRKHVVEKVFCLIAFGSTWERALKMWRNR